MAPLPWHAESAAAVAARLGSDAARGLSAADAAARLARDGRNEIRAARPPSAWRLLARQFDSLVIWVLLAAALVSAALGDLLDGAAIIAIVVLNAVMGFVQEQRAERAVAALARMTAPRARVVRDGAALPVAAAEVVCGDVLLLEAGDLVAADARLLDAHVLRTAEAALTGESTAVEKTVAPCAAPTPLADRSDMVFLGTSVVGGTARALVVATGMASEVGRIATLLEGASRPTTPLQRQLDLVGRRLLWACLAIVVVVFALGLRRAVPPLEMFLSAVSLAVAAVPEGLPAIVTLALALGVQRMARRQALVRRLPSVETLGCAQVICTDKTGTLTLGEMTARRLVTATRLIDVSGDGYGAQGGFFADGTEIAAGGDVALHALLVAAAACNGAELRRQGGAWLPVGDPGEAALLVLAEKGGVSRAGLDAQMTRLAELPFDSTRRRMSVVRRDGERIRVFVKGAPEEVTARCTRLRGDHGDAPLDAATRARLRETGARLAHDALRVLAVAERALPQWPAMESDIESDLTLLGLVGLQDPPRPEARAAVAQCRRAGIRAVMITGDHPDTARAIAREIGLLGPGDGLLTGVELDGLDDAALAARVERVAVFARVTAEHKLRVVRAWKARGAVVAMTGDGVNDAPALREASIGIAMGRSGTEVTKEAADMVITDDNFASIVAAVEEGRGIYDNIAKTLAYLLAGNAGELAVMLVAGLLGWPLPLLPIQLLWINLITDGLPALALATDPLDTQLLDRPPRAAAAALADRPFLLRTAFTGTLTAIVTLAAFALARAGGADAAAARNAAFTVLVLEELLRSFTARSATLTVWEIGLFSNLRLFAVVGVSLALQIAILWLAPLRAVFDTAPVSLPVAFSWIALAIVPSTVLEFEKLARRRRRGGA